MRSASVQLCLALSCLFIFSLEVNGQVSGWNRHTIDRGSRGADGIRVADLNRDGLFDLVTGWEEGGQIRVYTNPGPAEAQNKWPTTIVGNVPSPEDAVFADLDGNGHIDVVSCCEGRTRSVFVHWSENGQWTTRAFPQLENRMQWMYATPMDVDRLHGVDLIIGGKGTDAEIGWLRSPRDAQRVAEWTWIPLSTVGWVMSILTHDMDGDGDLDVLYSDRKGNTRGVHWLENESRSDLSQPWTKHTLGGEDREPMFLSVGDLNNDGKQDVAVAVKDGPMTWFERLSASGDDWKRHEVEMPKGTGSGKGVAIVDVDLDGTPDLIFSCEHAQQKVGVGWFSKSEVSDGWSFHDISGSTDGIKFDLIQTIDLDADGDLDVLTCEERDNLGVIWYENPTH